MSIMKNLKKIILVLFIVVACYFIFQNQRAMEYEPKDDEIKIKFQLSTDEDIGLIVFDYTANDHEFSGGISNANGSLLQKNSTEIQVFNQEELHTKSDEVTLSMHFRIITNYVKPNFENIYPEDLTKVINPPITWNAKFHNTYTIVITGNHKQGYQAKLIQK